MLNADLIAEARALHGRGQAHLPTALWPHMYRASLHEPGGHLLGAVLVPRA